MSASPSQFQDHSWLNSVHILGMARCHSLCECTWASVMICLKVTVFLKSSITSDAYNISASSSSYISEFWGEGLGEDVLFKTKCTQVFHSLHIVLLCVSGFIPFTSRRSFNDMGWADQICGLSIMSLGVILFFSFFSRIAIVGFVWAHDLSTLRLVVTLAVSFVGSILWNGS